MVGIIRGLYFHCHFQTSLAVSILTAICNSSILIIFRWLLDFQRMPFSKVDSLIHRSSRFHQMLVFASPSKFFMIPQNDCLAKVGILHAEKWHSQTPDHFDLSLIRHTTFSIYFHQSKLYIKVLFLVFKLYLSFIIFSIVYHCLSIPIVPSSNTCIQFIHCLLKITLSLRRSHSRTIHTHFRYVDNS